jgi:ABC-type dipeptide/oligopeptide/nickel transport system ATPase component
MTETPLLSIRDLNVEFATRRGTVRAVNGVNLSIYPGQTLAVVGESGSGKSVSALSTMQLVPSPPGKVTDGSITFDGQDVLSLNEKQMRSIRGNQIAMIFQEPMTSLNPVYTIGNGRSRSDPAAPAGLASAEAMEIAERALRTWASPSPPAAQ